MLLRSTTIILIPYGLAGNALVQAVKDVFSDKYLDKYCGLAQGQIANTDLDPTIESYDIFDPDFIQSITKPFDTAESLPFTVTQHVSTTTVSCKMKSWDALNFYYKGRAKASAGECSDVSRKIFKDVMKQLEKGDPTFSAPKIYFDDWVAYAGNQWTSEAPATTA